VIAVVADPLAKVQIVPAVRARVRASDSGIAARVPGEDARGIGVAEGPGFIELGDALLVGDVGVVRPGDSIKTEVLGGLAGVEVAGLGLAALAPTEVA
jgi:hypothetical protein